MRHVATVTCTNVIAQVNLGFDDDEGNLIGEETFPQVDGNLLTAKLFHPHTEQLARLIQTCVEQAWAKLGAVSRANLSSVQAPMAAEGLPPGNGTEESLVRESS